MTQHSPITPAAQSLTPGSSAHAPADVAPDTPPRTGNGPRWTPAKMAAFLRALASTHSVSAAAESVGMSRMAAYRLRARTRGKAFDIAWDSAFHQSYANLPYAALDRALNGVEVPVYYKGEKIDSYRRFDERLTVALLRMSGNPTTLMVGGHEAHVARHGRRFAAMLASIEAEGEAAKAVPEEGASDDFSADYAYLSRMSDDELLAELRHFQDGEGT